MTDENAPRRPIAEEIAEAAEREEIDLNLAAIERQMLRDHAEALVKQAAELGSAIFNRLAGELQEASHGASPILADRAYAERDKLAMEVKVGTPRMNDDGESFLEARGSSRQCTRDRHQAATDGVATGPEADSHLEHTGMRFLARIADGIDESGRREAAAGWGPRNEPGDGVDASDLHRSIGRLVDEGATT
jgi:hypothetical protein